MPKTIIVSTEASSYFTAAIAKQIPGTLVSTERKEFRDGERYFRLGVESTADLIGTDAIIVGSTHTDRDFGELYRVGSALATYGTRQRIFVIPFFGYSTMERAVLSGEVVSAKILARTLSSIPNTGMGNIFLLLDLHTEGLVHYFENHSMPLELRADALLQKGVSGLALSQFVFASADLGRPMSVQKLAAAFGVPIALIAKERRFETTEVRAVIGEVAGKAVVIYDDMVRSGGSLVHAAQAYLDHGATEVYAAISHLALTDESAIDILENSPIRKIITTNSHPMSQHPRIISSKKFLVLDVSPVFKSAIQKIIS